VTEPGTLTAAVAAAARGWHVFPLAPRHKTPRRQLTDWEAKATTDPVRIER
jgi:Bifunctional DNA primase/polymerase, N-terminal